MYNNNFQCHNDITFQYHTANTATSKHNVFIQYQLFYIFNPMFCYAITIFSIYNILKSEIILIIICVYSWLYYIISTYYWRLTITDDTYECMNTQLRWCQLNGHTDCCSCLFQLPKIGRGFSIFNNEASTIKYQLHWLVYQPKCYL